MRFPAAALLPLILLAPGRALAYGEPAAPEVPSAEERLLHVLTNQVRQAPAEWPGWTPAGDETLPLPPLILDGGLAKAAHAHAVEMASSGVFSHSSPDGTSFGDRIARYFSGDAEGENIYEASFTGARAAITDWMNSPGHRANILSGQWSWMGPGIAAGGGFDYVQDFGARGTPAVPAIPAGAVEPLVGGKAQLIAGWFDAGGAAPRGITAQVDGAAVPLAVIAGAGGNATYAATIAAPKGCAAVAFIARGPGGATTRFPTTGALQVGAACTASYVADAGAGSGADGAPGDTDRRAGSGAPPADTHGGAPAGGFTGTTTGGCRCVLGASRARDLPGGSAAGGSNGGSNGGGLGGQVAGLDAALAGGLIGLLAAGTVRPRGAGSVRPRGAGSVRPRGAGSVRPRGAGRGPGASQREAPASPGSARQPGASASPPARTSA